MSVGPQEKSGTVQSAPQKSISVSTSVKGWDVLDEGFASLQGKLLLNLSPYLWHGDDEAWSGCSSYLPYAMNAYQRSEGHRQIVFNTAKQRFAEVCKPTQYGQCLRLLLEAPCCEFAIALSVTFLCRISSLKDEGLGQGRRRNWGFRWRI